MIGPMQVQALESVAPSRWRGIALALAAAALWGTTGTAQSLAPLALSPVWVGAWRLVVAALFFVALSRGLAAAEGKNPLIPAGATPAATGWTVLAAAASIAVYNLCFFAGVRASGVAVGTAVAIGSGPIWAGLIQRLMLRQSLTPAWWAGTALAVAGGTLMVTVGQGVASVPWVGMVLCLGAGLSYAAYTFFNKHLVRVWSPAGVNARVFGGAALMCCAVAPALAPWSLPDVRSWAVLLWLGVVATGVSYLLFTTALRTISGPTGVALALGEPVTAFALAVLVVGERPGWSALGGLMLVLAGLAMVIRAELRGDPGRR